MVFPGRASSVGVGQATVAATAAYATMNAMCPHHEPQSVNGDAQYEQDLQRIEQWWHAHRGENWHPVHIEVRRPPIEG